MNSADLAYLITSVGLKLTSGFLYHGKRRAGAVCVPRFFYFERN